MIIDDVEENLDLLAITACPDDLWSNENCMLVHDELFNGQYNGSVVECCHACWLKYLSKESEDNHEK